MEINHLQCPMELFQEWLREAGKTELNDPEAMALATVGDGGRPSVRMVLLKHVDEKGFSFYTNMESRKGQELAKNPQAALCIYWKSLHRQVRVEGQVERLPRTEVEAYFATRHPLSRLGAWASAQSRPLASRAELIKHVEEAQQRFGEKDIPCPPYWGGYRLAPDKIEFWQEGDARLHDRFLFTRAGAGWTVVRLNP